MTDSTLPMSSTVGQLPSPDDNTSTNFERDQQPIREELLTNLSEGSHHGSDEVPASGTPLPGRESLERATTMVEDYLTTVGCLILGSAHLRGHAAPVWYSQVGTVYAYVDSTVFDDIVKTALQTCSAELNADVAVLGDAIQICHSLEFHKTITQQNINPEREASWASNYGKHSDSITPIILSTPHPLQSLQDHPNLQARALGMTAGIQQLTRDISGQFSQTDIALPYLAAQFKHWGLSEGRTRSELLGLYDISAEVLDSLLTDINAAISRETLPTDDIGYRYYLPSGAVEELVS